MRAAMEGPGSVNARLARTAISSAILIEIRLHAGAVRAAEQTQCPSRGAQSL
jgi:hypothetical protein